MIKRILKSTIFQFILVFISIFIAFYFYRGLNTYFLGEDSYYHVAMAKYMMQNGAIVHQFPYMQFTVLKDAFVDWHFGFHLLLIPFIKIFGENIGPKILVNLLVTGSFSLVFLILKEIKIKFAFLYAIVLFFIMPQGFYERLMFVRDPVLALFLMLLSLYLLLKNRPLVLSITIYFFVLSSPAAYFIIVAIVGYIIIQIIRNEKINYHILFYAIGGYLLGVMLNPYFPLNIKFLKVFITASQNDRWYAGQELLPYSTWIWFYSSIMAVILFFSGILLAYIKNIQLKSEIVAILLFTIFMIINQWKSLRFVEYWPILGGMTGIILFGSYVEEIIFKFKKNWRKIESIIIAILLMIFIYLGVFHGIWEYWAVKDFRNNTQNVESIKEISDYLEKNSKNEDIVFARWDIFPNLFYFNHGKNYYIVGLDPVWLEHYNKDLFNKYLDLTLNGDSKVDLNVIKNDFNSQWVVLNSTSKLKEKMISNSDLFQKVFENKNFTIFKVI